MRKKFVQPKMHGLRWSKEQDEVMRDLISRSVKEPIWAKETKIAQKLLNMPYELDFWKSFAPPFRFNSLSFLLTEEGGKIIEKQYNLLKLEVPKTKKWELEEKPVCEPSKISREPKTIIQFCKKYGETKRS